MSSRTLKSSHIHFPITIDDCVCVTQSELGMFAVHTSQVGFTIGTLLCKIIIEASKVLSQEVLLHLG